MEYPRDSPLRGRGLMGGRSPLPQPPLVHSLVSPKMDPCPSPAGSPYVAGSPLLGGSPCGIPRSPLSPGFMVKSEPPVSPSGPSDYSLNPKKPRCEGGGLGDRGGGGLGDRSGMYGDRSGMDRSGMLGDRSGMLGDRSGMLGDRSGASSVLGDRVEWSPSPGAMSIDSMSPPPQSSNGMSGGSVGHPSNGMSPMSSSSYDPSSPYPSRSGRDDMSPPSSESYGDLKKKKGPLPRQQEELCLVCGDRASGYHYNALTCEGCKGFFRRSITKNAVYQCKYGNNCEMDMYMRRKCQECRLKKCLSVGMRPECVVPESQCQVKREAKKARDKDKKDYPSIGSPIQDDKTILISPVSFECKPKGPSPACAMQFKTHVGSSSIGQCPLPMAQRLNVKPLTREQEELINTLVYYQDEFEQPSEDDLKKIKDYEISDDDSDAKFKHITDMTILTVQLIVEFSKRLPGFDTLLREDQITLLKACSSEVMMLRAARRYDSKTDSIVFGNNFPYTQHSYELAGLGDSAASLFRFCRNLCKMKVDNAEYALLAAIAIFSERPNLKELSKVEKLQEIYLEALKSYVENRRMPRSSMVFAKLLNILTELRTLGNLNSEVCFSLTLKNKRLPPFLAEIWDVNMC